MEFYVYVIENARGMIYIGHTNNLSSRLKRHNGQLPTKSKSYTRKQGGSWELVYEERVGTRGEAIRREKELKSSRGREFLKQFRKYR